MDVAELRATNRSRLRPNAWLPWWIGSVAGIAILLTPSAVAVGQSDPGPKYEAALEQAVRLYGDGKFKECGDALDGLVRQFPKGATPTTISDSRGSRPSSGVRREKPCCGSVS